MTRRSIGTIDNDKKMQRRDMQREGVKGGSHKIREIHISTRGMLKN